MSLPKYFKNLHLTTSAITGTPRIVNIDFSKTNLSDKYIDVPKEEFEGTLIGYFQSFPENSRQLIVTDKWTTVAGINASSKADLIKILEGIIEEVKGLEE